MNPSNKFPKELLALSVLEGDIMSVVMATQEFPSATSTDLPLPFFFLYEK